MATEKQLNQVAELGPQITAIPVDELVVNPSKLGTLTFEAARSDLEIIFQISKELIRLPFQVVPEPAANPIITYLTQCREVVNQIAIFNVESASGAPAAQRDQYVALVKEIATNLLTSAAPWIPFLAYQQGDVQRNIDSMTVAARGIATTFNDAKIEAEKSKLDLSKIVQAARDASPVAGVGVFTADFSEQANALDKDANKWLTVTTWAAGITLTVAVVSMFIHIGDSPAEIAQFLTSKVLALVVLISATVWCGRIYKATMHQAATNRHRAHALKTFQAFTQASDDEGTRNAVLLEATRSIFAISPSGYLETTEQAADSGTKVLEIIKGINGKG
ncbi:MAG: hypothetical protein EOO38_15415 [Cytophagaceae bacterium]|nr:MAG: hypothetical protein EOO38_15415 [Cytophagaceae bacterium]